MELNKYYSFKRINRSALLYGLPYTVFFLILGWTIILGLSVISVKIFALRLILGFIMLLGIVGIFVIYTKFGLTRLQKEYDLIFRDPKTLKYNKPLEIKKLPNDHK